MPRSLIKPAAAGVAVFALAVHAIVVAGDWPMFGHDARRSQTTDAHLDFDRFSAVWDWQSNQPPLAAWGQPAKGDAFANLRDFQSMRNYDPVFHPIIFGDRVYFGSNVDDSVRCLDAFTGKVRWIFTAGGPVRIAPSFHDGKLYFGADDGYAYCLRADTGELLWRMSPSDSNAARMVLNNGRLISFWPCRSGVLVEHGTAYFTCSLLPWKPSYLCAVDAETGQPEGEGRYVREISGATLEGALVGGSDLLYSPQGRESPLQFQRSDGRSLGALGEGFGVFCVLTPDNRLLHGPRKKGGGIVDSDAKTRAPVATHKDARAMIVTSETSLLLTDSQLAAGDLTARKLRWTTPQRDVAAMVLAGDAVILGRKDRVTALSVETGKELWQAAVDGRAYGLAVAGGALYVSTETGQLLCFRPGEAVVHTRPDDEVAKARPPSPEPLPIAAMEDKSLLGRWVFSPLTAKDVSAGVEFSNLAGGLPATLTGKKTFTQDAGLDAVQLDGAANSILITRDLAKAKLPQREMSAEAWVRIDRPQEWGGIVGATQDNGNYERGWLLGFRHNKFSLSLAGKDASGRLTYMNAADDFERGQWHHVVGTYDGTTMRLYVDGRLSASNTGERGDINYPPNTFYEIGAYHDDNEHYHSAGLVHEVRVYNRVLSPDEVQTHFKSKPLSGGGEVTLAAGPWIRFDSDSSALVRWHSHEAIPSRLALTDDVGRTRIIKEKQEQTKHELKLEGLRRDRRYSLVIEVLAGKETKSTRSFELDTYFNYNLAALPDSARISDEASDDKYAEAAVGVTSRYNRPHGLCLVVGSETGELAMELARRHNLRVIGLETDADKIAAARRRAVELGVYGPRCSFVHVGSLATLPAPSNVANLVVSQTALSGELNTPTEELHRILQPGGRVDIGFDKRKIAAVKDPLPGAADWTHMYGDASNAAYAGETLGGAKSVGDLETAWLGRPGPRYQTDRQNRKSSPLFAGGRLYMQGQERIIAVDGYNGLILWSLEIPGLLRFNIPRDAANWCCDKEHLFIAMADRCWQIDGATGKVVAMHAANLPDKKSEPMFDWGYVARAGDLLLGSAVRPDSSYDKFWGVEYWFDHKSGPFTHQVCSDRLFALDKSSGRRAWTYDGGMVWNASITVGGGRVYLIESRNAAAAAAKTGRVPTGDLGEEQFLVAIDLSTGKPVWEQAIKSPPNLLLSNMAYSDERLVLVDSADKLFHVTSLAAADGKQQWHTKVAWPRSDHGGHLSRPAIVGNRIFVRPATLEMQTGEVLSNNMPGGGCGTYVCAKDALFFRAGSGKQLSSWEPATGQYKQWPRLRPDCWLSTIPAGGMLLSPEGGGGCSCGHWMEMSVGFQPRGRD